MGDVAALLGGVGELLDGRVGEIQQRAVRRGLGCLLLRHLFLLRRRIKKEGSSLSSRPCIGSNFGRKMDLGAFTGRGQGGPCLTDAAQ